MFERNLSCHHRGRLEYQYDPFLVGSLYSCVARGTALMFDTWNVSHRGGNTEGYLEKKEEDATDLIERGHKEEVSKDIKDIFFSSDKERERRGDGLGWNQKLKRVKF